MQNLASLKIICGQVVVKDQDVKDQVVKDQDKMYQISKFSLCHQYIQMDF